MEFNEVDLWAINELKEFLPNKIFDSHAHFYDSVFCPNISGRKENGCYNRKKLTQNDYNAEQTKFYGKNVQVQTNMIVAPFDKVMSLSNEYRSLSTDFLCRELDLYPENVGEILVLAKDKVDDIEKQLRHKNIRGLKCYYTTVLNGNILNLSVEQFLPESAFIVANKYGMAITLHLVKDLALSDKDNFDYIIKMARKYSNARLILAHCARAFAPWTALTQIRKLKSYQNIYFDVSAICESPVIFEIIKQCGTDRVLWGSDYPGSLERGKCISIGNTFFTANSENCFLLQGLKPEISCCYLGLENMLALKQACILADSDVSSINKIFYNNAIKVFDIFQ